ncbi:uncharacterized protein BO97DRAFT_412644 [Aspergillus homomorphus CBS 101889]|uniref:Uncharacterized protein n=1 Tax=Aspergillus homomorphus (strain CBS 101889) TaxID=1450537 RepID=A0A395I3Z0_ASPHC|nr:hypothetical protein BO97DRAFT_412644 [Aspergillus homomorphus CBS 101889]RAL14323.1 hypothetical protein BO97DRAFT_412644 [Aspergillus homomorphus CBS 101889]
MQAPQEIYDMIVSHVDDVDSRPWATPTRQHKIPSDEIRHHLATLRLVNRAFCRSASPRLFRHLRVTAKSAQSKTAESPLVGLVELSHGPYADYVRQIDIGLEDTEHSDEFCAMFLEDLAGLLPSCLSRLPKLRALDFQGVPASLPEATTRDFVNTVISSLRYVPLPNLTELEIAFPLTHDFAQFFPNKTISSSALRISAEHVLQRLDHLGLRITASTSEHAQPQYEPPVPPPATAAAPHTALPNQTHAHWLFKMIRHASNLKSLSISSADTLDLDGASFSRSLRLQSIQLRGVSISSYKLLSLVEQCKDSIRHIELYQVQLNSGEWQHVLSRMTNLPGLVGFVIKSCGYSSRGAGATYYNHHGTQTAGHGSPGPVMKTTNSTEILALGALQRRVHANRTNCGLAPFRETEYRRRLKSI